MADGVIGRPTSGTGPEESVPTAPTGVPDLAQVLGGRCVKRGCFNAADQAALEAAGARPADPALLRGYTDSAAATNHQITSTNGKWYQIAATTTTNQTTHLQ